MAVNRRLLAWSLAGALLVGVGGGWWWSSRGDDDRNGYWSAYAPDDGQTIGTNADVLGDPFPSVERVRTSDGASAPVLAYARPTVVNFWYTTCPPCRREMPTLGEAARRWAGQVDFVGINPLDSRDRANEFLDQAGAEFETFLDPDGELMSMLGVVTMPVTLFVSADGEILEVHAGEITAEVLDATIGDAFGI